MPKKRYRKLGKRYGKDNILAKPDLWLFGVHAASAAIDNPNREVIRILATENIFSRLLIADDLNRPKPELVEREAIEQFLPQGAVHQGIAVQVKNLEPSYIEDIIDTQKTIILLDQVTDPHNIGAVLRSAAAFDAAGVVTTSHNSPGETAILAKSASGALESVPLITVSNLANTIKELKKSDYWIWGMDGNASTTLKEEAKKGTDNIALVMGAEGKGLRRLTAELCDLHVKLAMDEKMESLNISAAAAIALYELYGG